MLTAGFAIMWAGYGLASWGWCVLKGYDVPFVSWFNPVHPFDWSAPPGQIPDTQVWPSGGVAASPAPATQAAPPKTTAAKTAKTAG